MSAAASTETRTRASALPPDERRAAIVKATVPLLIEHGSAVSTRQIAEAAGIAEGTIFRVFPDKQAVIAAAVEAAFESTWFEKKVAAIDRAQPMEAQLVEATHLLQRRFAVIWHLLPVAREAGLIQPGQRRPLGVQALTDLIAPYADRLRVDPEIAARRLRSLALATSNPGFEPDGPVPPEELVSLLLDGIRRPAPRKSR
jgi:AcrR family transcriptional regulator